MKKRGEEEEKEGEEGILMGLCAARPGEFGKAEELEDSDDGSEEESTMGKMPPRSDDEECA